MTTNIMDIEVKTEIDDLDMLEQRETCAVAIDMEPKCEPVEKSNDKQNEHEEEIKTHVMYSEPKDGNDLYSEEGMRKHIEVFPKQAPIVVKKMKVDENDLYQALQSLPSNLLIKDSSIDGAGLGVFTDIGIPPGTTYGPFDGIEIRAPKQANSPGGFWQIHKSDPSSHSIDAKDSACSNWMRYVNCALSESYHNLVAILNHGKIYYRCIKPILPKSELLVMYGEDRVRKFGITKDSSEKVKETQRSMPIEGNETKCNKSLACDDKPSLITKHEGQKPKESIGCKSTRKDSTIPEDMRINAGDYPFPCSICKKAFRFQCALKAHMRIHTGEKPFKCKECGKSYTEQSTLNVHMRQHTGETPYKCTFCVKAFQNITNLKAHMRIHTGEKPYQCTYCDKAFSQPSGLKSHMRTHTGEKPHMCTECGKAFSHPSSLQNHMRIHTGEKPFKCTECGKAFSINWNLQTHMKKHKEGKTVECTDCEKTFRSTSQYKVHMMLIHPGDKISD